MLPEMTKSLIADAVGNWFVNLTTYGLGGVVFGIIAATLTIAWIQSLRWDVLPGCETSEDSEAAVIPAFPEGPIAGEIDLECFERIESCRRRAGDLGPNELAMSADGSVVSFKAGNPLMRSGGSVALVCGANQTDVWNSAVAEFFALAWNHTPGLISKISAMQSALRQQADFNSRLSSRHQDQVAMTKLASIAAVRTSESLSLAELAELCKSRFDGLVELLDDRQESIDRLLHEIEGSDRIQNDEIERTNAVIGRLRREAADLRQQIRKLGGDTRIDRWSAFLDRGAAPQLKGSVSGSNSQEIAASKAATCERNAAPISRAAE